MATPRPVDPLVVVKQDVTTTGVFDAATWVQKTTNGKVWLTDCRIKVRTLADNEYDVEFLCQMRNTIDRTWLTVQRHSHIDDALHWLHQA